jgi:hypothetical protein
MPNPDTIHIGGQTRTLRVNTEAVLFAQNLLPQRMTVREALTTGRDVGTMVVLALAAFRTEDKKISGPRLFGWLDAEKGKSKELEAKVVAAYEAYYGLGGYIDDDDAEKKDEQVPAPSASGETPSG